MTHLVRYPAACAVIALLLLFSACFGASPMIKRERGPSGQQLEKNTLDMSFVHAGTTTRAEVLSKLSSVNTGYDDAHLFWARWATSNWGYGWMVIAPATNGGGGSGAGDAKRVWHVHNLLIAFDEHGIVQTKQSIDDNDELWRELHKYVATLPPVNATEAVSFPFGKYGERHITFGADGISAHRARGKVKSVNFAADKVIRITHSGAKDKRNGPGISCHVLELREKTAFGKNISFCADGRNLIATFRYLQRFASPNMLWE